MTRPPASDEPWRNPPAADAAPGGGERRWAAHPPRDPEQRRIARRRALDRRRIHQAFRALADVLDPRRPAVPELRETADPLFAACRLVCAAQGVELRPVEPTGARPGGRLIEIAESNGVRYRRVLLRDDWWRQDNGPLLAFRGPRGGREPGDRGDGGGGDGGAGDGAEDDVLGRPLALLPVGGGRRYDLVDPATGERRRVDGELAAGLSPRAFMFYPPLPDRPLRFTDLVRAGLGRRGRDLAALAGVSLGLGLLALLLPLVTERVVDVAIAHADRVELAHMVLALAVAALAASLFQVVRGLLVVRVRGKLDGSLQSGLWDRLLSLPVPFFRRFTVGDLEARAMGIDRIRDLLGGFVTASLLSGVSAVFSLGVLFFYSISLALVATGSALALALFVAAVSVLQLRHQRQLHDQRGKMASLLYALLSGIVKLRVANAELRAYSAWVERFARLRRLEVIVQRLTNLQTVGGVTYSVATTLVLFALVGSWRGLDLGVGELLAFFAAFGQFTAAALAIVGVIPTVLSAVPVYERMVPILETVPDVARRRAKAGRLAGDVELRDVSFRYHPSGPLVLDGVSIEVRRGELVALVGPSGSGKTTCLRLMLGFEEPSRGQVLVDGRPLEDLDLQSVRRQMGVVLQNSRPLVGDILHNIIGARPLSKEDAWRAAAQVGLDEEIRRMPMGMHTFVNQRGVAFSGGQRQRLLLARAIVDDPRILLLDEATSALDNRTQDLVIRNLEAMRVTRIVVAHRLSTIRRADRIVVLDRGRVVDQGTYDELAGRDGLFRRLIERQVARPAELRTTPSAS
jgi:NHLM bacteriocin system ABC transporter ATP-binding protein